MVMTIDLERWRSWHHSWCWSVSLEQSTQWRKLEQSTQWRTNYYLLLMVKRKKIPEKGETQPATVRQSARLGIRILNGKFLGFQFWDKFLRNPKLISILGQIMSVRNISILGPVVENGPRNPPSENLIGKPNIWPRLGKEVPKERK